MPLRPDPFLARFEPVRAIRSGKPWVGYAIGTVGVGAALAVRSAIPAGVAPFTTFYPVIILAALLGGWRPGVLAVVLSALAADYFLIPPTNSFSTSWAACLSIIVLR